MQTYGLIGHPLGHSFSASYFAKKFAAEQLAATYTNHDLSQIAEVESLRGLDGFNVTIPYKQAILPYLEGISEEARAIGAVNTVKVVGGKFYGFNTDVVGFRESLRAWLEANGVSPQNALRALVLGTGGASRAVCHALGQLGIAHQLVSRTPQVGQMSYDDVAQWLPQEGSQQRALIVNCTPLGTYPRVETSPELPYERLHQGVMLYDLVYNPEETLFLRRGREAGCATKNGLEMLHRQAEAAWAIWQEALS